ncbi:MAG: PKD domain-containing protein [Acidobacteriota bacterium]
MKIPRLAAVAMTFCLVSAMASGETRYAELARASASIVLPPLDAQDRSPLDATGRRIVRLLVPDLPSAGAYQYPRYAPRLIAGLKGGVAAPPHSTRTIGPNVNVSNRAGGQSTSAITLDFQNPVFLAAASNDLAGTAQAQYASSDSGATWAYRALPLGTRSFHADPSVAYDDAGVLFSAALGIQPSVAVQICRSTDRGLSWSAPVEADVDNGNDKELMAADNQSASPCAGNVYVAWDRVGVAARFSRSTDGGLTFSPSIVLAPGDFIGASPAVGPNGEVYVSYSDNAAPRIVIFKSTDCGATFSGPVAIAGTTATFDIGIPEMCDRRALVYPACDVDRSSGTRRGWVYVSWTDGTDGGPCPSTAGTTDVFFSRSSDAGATWSAPITVHEPLPTSEQFNPWLAVDPGDGSVNVSYNDSRNDAARLLTDVYYSRSTDGGSTFEPSVKVTTAPTDETCCGADLGNQYGDYSGIVAMGKIHPSWTDRRASGAEEIYTAEISIAPPVADFSGSPTSGAPPLSVAFTDLSTNAPTSWSWTFGDGGTSAVQSPGHVYSSVGIYDVALTACNALGCDTESKPAYINVTNTAVIDEVITGAGYGPANVPEVRIWNHANPPITVANWNAYGAGGYGANVAAGSIDGSVRALTGPGPGPVYGPQVRGFTNTGVPLPKVNFYAYGTLKFGVNVSRGDVDNDAFAEILTGAGPGPVFGPHIRGWNYDGATITPIPGLSFFAFSTLKYGVNLAGGSLDADGFAEIAAGPGPGLVFGPTIRAFNWDGGPITPISKVNFNAFPTSGYGTRVETADVDVDAFAEIAAARGPGATHDSTTSVFDYDGASISPLFSVTPFPGLFYGAHPGAGDYNGDGGAELAVSPGPAPANPSDAIAYHWDGTATTIFVPRFSAYALTYGTQVTGGDMGSI